MMMIPKYLDIVADDYREYIHDIEQMNQSGYWLADFTTQQLSLSRGACERTLFIPPSGYVKVRYQTLFDDNDRPERRVGALYDISARVEQENRALSFQRELITSFFNSVVLITQAIESRDPYTSKHQYSVAAISLAIGEQMGLSDHDKVGLWLGAAIHDIGKIGVPIAILGKPGKLRDTEFALIKEHPKIAESILHTAHYPWPIKDIVTQHHERLDGTGYPYGLKGDQIHLGPVNTN